MNPQLAPPRKCGRSSGWSTTSPAGWGLTLGVSQRERMEKRDQSLIDSVLNSGKPLRDLRPAFPSREAALQHYGKVQSEAHDADQQADTCEGCGATSPEITQTISWATMVYKAKWLFWSFLVSLVTSLFDFTVEKSLCISFKTHHRICKRCHRGQKVKQALHGMVKKPRIEYECTIYHVMCRGNGEVVFWKKQLHGLSGNVPA